MTGYPYIFYAEPSMIATLPLSRVVWIPSRLKNPEELFQAYRRQLPATFSSRLQNHWNSLDLCLQNLAHAEQPLTFLVHENLPALPENEQLLYVRILSNNSLKMETDRSNLTVMFPLEDMQRLQKLYNILKNEHKITQSV